MTWGVVLVQYYIFNMSNHVWMLLPQGMHEIAGNHLEQNNLPATLCNKSFKHSIEIWRGVTCDILKSDVKVCCAVYLLIQAIIVTFRTVCPLSQSMASGAHFTIRIRIIRLFTGKMDACCSNHLNKLTCIFGLRRSGVLVYIK